VIRWCPRSKFYATTLQARSNLIPSTERLEGTSINLLDLVYLQLAPYASFGMHLLLVSWINLPSSRYVFDIISFLLPFLVDIAGTVLMFDVCLTSRDVLPLFRQVK
jgi:hypothetical protein